MDAQRSSTANAQPVAADGQPFCGPWSVECVYYVATLLPTLSPRHTYYTSQHSAVSRVTRSFALAVSRRVSSLLHAVDVGDQAACVTVSFKTRDACATECNGGGDGTSTTFGHFTPSRSHRCTAGGQFIGRKLCVAMFLSENKVLLLLICWAEIVLWVEVSTDALIAVN